MDKNQNQDIEPKHGVEIRIVDAENGSIINGFELGSYQDREPGANQSQSSNQQNVPVDDSNSTSNDTNNTSSN